MAGYKSTIQSLEPVCFITFDGDAFDEIGRTYTAEPPVILDESGFDNHGIFHTSDPRAYRAGMPSCVKLESDEQYSIGFAYYGSVDGDWKKAYVEVPHSSDFNFGANGEFTVLWSSKKDEDQEMTWRQTVNPPSTNTNTINRPIINKVGVFEVWHRYQYNPTRAARIVVKCPGGVDEVWVNMEGNYHGAERHFALVWDTFLDPSTGDKMGKCTLYVDAYAVIEQTFNYYDSWPSMDVASPILIGGNNVAPTNNSDRNTSNFQMDQIAVFNKALSAHQIGKLYKKTMSYEALVLNSRPANYWALNDLEDPNDYTVERVTGTLSATTVGGESRVTRYRPGPYAVPGSVSTHFEQGGQLVIRNTGNSAIVNVNANYAIEFWFSASGSTPGALFAQTGLHYPFNGLTVTLNMHNNTAWPGGIQIQETEQDFVSIPGSYNDGLFHHFVVQRNGDMMEMYVDGLMRASKLINKVSSAIHGQITMMSTQPGRLSVNGNLAFLATFTRAMQEQEIAARANYSRTYNIKGTVTLRGIPYAGNVRAYSHFDGNLVSEVISDSDTGLYLIDLYDNRLIDIVVMSVSDPTIRYRVYGPVTPSEYEDLA